MVSFSVGQTAKHHVNKLQYTISWLARVLWKKKHEGTCQVLFLEELMISTMETHTNISIIHLVLEWKHDSNKSGKTKREELGAILAMHIHCQMTCLMFSNPVNVQSSNQKNISKASSKTD